jgi:Holliday junction DNA helicase RuvA
MIAFLHGTLVEALPTQVLVDVHGVGYQVFIPLSSYEKLPPVGQPVRLLTELIVREDAHLLYGFLTAAERDTFRLLVHTVNGIGPKIALNVLSGMSVAAFRAAVTRGDLRALSQIPGVGRKTAERIVVELRDKLGATLVNVAPSSAGLADAADPKWKDAVLALMALGYKTAEAQDSVRAVAAELGPQAGVEELVRAALKRGVPSR